MLKISRSLVLLAAIITSVLLMFWLPAIPQDQQYHQFADQRMFFSLPNFMDVMSNLLFVLVGGMGIRQLVVIAHHRISPGYRRLYIILFVGSCLLGLASAYYHWFPSDQRLMWDRLAMVVVFMALFCIVLAELVSPSFVGKSLSALIMLGWFSVIYWYYTELNGSGDLRLYALVQFLPSVLILLMLLLYSKRIKQTNYLFVVILLYALAKIAEHYDALIFHALGFLSGHTVKHSLSALALFVMLLRMKRIN